MNPAKRVLTEYAAMCHVLEGRDLLALAAATVTHGRTILRTHKLTTLDRAMSRTMIVRFSKTRIVLPLADIDRILSAINDNPTFGNVREIYARNIYLKHFNFKRPPSAILDAGANRGMFSIVALLAFNAQIAVGVEPVPLYESVHQLLMEANNCNMSRAPRYLKYLSNPSDENRDPAQNISIKTILKEHNIVRFNLAKIDIEGGEQALFDEPEWLANVDNIAIEFHPDKVNNSLLVPEVLERYGLKYKFRDNDGRPADLKSATFLYASCTGELKMRE